MRVAVIGAGIVGASVARGLAHAGADVTVYEQSSPGAGTSGTTFAWVNSHDKRPNAYHRLNVEACKEHRRLAESADGGADWYFPNGNLEWAAGTQERERLEARVARLQATGYSCRWIDPTRARRLEPDLLLSPDVDRLALFEDEAHVLPISLLARLLGEARDAGATIRCPAQVASVDPSPSHCDVVLSTGERERFDRVVSCTGRWSERFLAALGVRVPLVDPDQHGGAAVGFLAYTAPVPTRLSRVLTGPRINVRPDSGGRLVLQGLDLDAEADPSDVPLAQSPVADELVRRLAEVLDIAGAATVDAVRVGQRALPADGLTVAGYAEQLSDRLYVVATHSGVTLGPLLGRLVAGEVLRDQASASLAEFRPSRFAAGGEAVTVRPARSPGEQ